METGLLFLGMPVGQCKYCKAVYWNGLDQKKIVTLLELENRYGHHRQ